MTRDMTPRRIKMRTPLITIIALLGLSAPAAANVVSLRAVSLPQVTAAELPSKDARAFAERGCREAYSGVRARSEMRPSERKAAISRCVAATLSE